MDLRISICFQQKSFIHPGIEGQGLSGNLLEPTDCRLEASVEKLAENQARPQG